MEQRGPRCRWTHSWIWLAGVFCSGWYPAERLPAADERIPLPTNGKTPVPVVTVVSAETAGQPDINRRLQVLDKGDSSREMQKAAERVLNNLRLAPADRQRVQSVLQQTTYFRALPLLQFETDPRTYLYLTHQPDVTVGLWRAMGISKFHLQQIAPNRFLADTGDGTKGTIEVLYRSAGLHLILCEGILKSPLLLRSIKTRSIIHLQTQFSRQKDGRVLATHRAFVHVSFPSTTVRTVARLLAPMGNLILDKNFREMSLFVHVMSLAMKRQPGWVEKMSHRLSGVSQRKKKDLLKVTARVYTAARRRETIPLFKTRREYVKEIVHPLTVTQTSQGKNSSEESTAQSVVPLTPRR